MEALPTFLQASLTIAYSCKPPTPKSFSSPKQHEKNSYLWVIFKSIVTLPNIIAPPNPPSCSIAWSALRPYVAMSLYNRHIPSKTNIDLTLPLMRSNCATCSLQVMPSSSSETTLQSHFPLMCLQSHPLPQLQAYVPSSKLLLGPA